MIWRISFILILSGYVMLFTVLFHLWLIGFHLFWLVTWWSSVILFQQWLVIERNNTLYIKSDWSLGVFNRRSCRFGWVNFCSKYSFLPHPDSCVVFFFLLNCTIHLLHFVLDTQNNKQTASVMMLRSWLVCYSCDWLYDDSFISGYLVYRRSCNQNSY